MKSDIVDTNVILDLSRQYKTMQQEVANKVKGLEKEVRQLTEELGMDTFNFNIYIQMNKDIGVPVSSQIKSEGMPVCICLSSSLSGGTKKREKRARAGGTGEGRRHSWPPTQAGQNGNRLWEDSARELQHKPIQIKASSAKWSEEAATNNFDHTSFKPHAQNVPMNKKSH